MMSAAVRKSFFVLRILPAGSSSVSPTSPRTSGITATPVSNPDSPSASLGNRMTAMELGTAPGCQARSSPNSPQLFCRSSRWISHEDRPE
jgi:hypothetical protein